MHEEEYYDYADFGKRVGAFLIDGLILGVGYGVVGGIFATLFIGTAGSVIVSGNEFVGVETIAMGIIFYLLFMLAIIAGSWLYFALQESSPRMATIGKRAMGIVVTDMEGNRISFAKASLRFFGKWISGAIMYIGYIMAAFTERKQALHDMIANSLVMEDH